MDVRSFMTVLSSESKAIAFEFIFYPTNPAAFLNRSQEGIYNLILPAALGPGIYSASNRNEYQKHKNNDVSGDYYLNISQPYRPARPVTGIALFFFFLLLS
jgi:hypothetical protein